MPQIRVDIADAVELTELLQFVNDWLASDTECLDASLTHYVGHPGCTADELRADLDRFIFLLWQRRRTTLRTRIARSTPPMP